MLAFAQGSVTRAPNYPGVFNVRDYGAIGNGIANDSTAVIAAMNAANARATAGFPAIVLFPSGFYLVSSSLPQLVKNTCIYGDGPHRSYVCVSTAYSGDLFSWSDAFNASGSGDPTPDQNGAAVIGLSIIGMGLDSRSGNTQHAIMLYDRNDNVRIEDVEIWYMNGRALGFGFLQNKTQAYLRESFIKNLRVNVCGNSTYPSVDWCATGTGDTSNQIRVYNLNILQTYGKGLHIHNKNTTKTTGSSDFFGLRVENMLGTDDLMVIGDGTDQGGVAKMNFYGMRLTNCALNQFCLTVKAPNSTAAAQINNLFFDITECGPGSGGGINVQAGKLLQFQVGNFTCSQTDLTVAASANGVGPSIVATSRYGAESSWTTSVDGTTTVNKYSLTTL